MSVCERMRECVCECMCMYEKMYVSMLVWFSVNVWLFGCLWVNVYGSVSDCVWVYVIVFESLRLWVSVYVSELECMWFDCAYECDSEFKCMRMSVRMLVWFSVNVWMFGCLWVCPSGSVRDCAWVYMSTCESLRVWVSVCECAWIYVIWLCIWVW